MEWSNDFETFSSSFENKIYFKDLDFISTFTDDLLQQNHVNSRKNKIEFSDIKDHFLYKEILNSEENEIFSNSILLNEEILYEQTNLGKEKEIREKDKKIQKKKEFAKKQQYTEAKEDEIEVKKVNKIQNKKIYKKKIVLECEKKKNLARYIIKNCILSITSGNYKEVIENLPSMNDKIYEEFIEYFKINIEKIKNIPSIRNHCTQNSSDENENLRNFQFVEFCKYYLKYQYPKYVLINGKIKSENKKLYLNYANFLRMKIQDPQNFYSNT